MGLKVLSWPLVCLIGNTALSLRDHLEMHWSCPSGRVEPLGLDVGFGGVSPRKKSQRVLRQEQPLVSPRSCFDSTLQVGEKPER